MRLEKCLTPTTWQCKWGGLNDTLEWHLRPMTLSPLQPTHLNWFMAKYLSRLAVVVEFLKYLSCWNRRKLVDTVLEMYPLMQCHLMHIRQANFGVRSVSSLSNLFIHPSPHDQREAFQGKLNRCVIKNKELKMLSFSREWKKAFHSIIT